MHWREPYICAVDRPTRPDRTLHSPDTPDHRTWHFAQNHTFRMRLRPIARATVARRQSAAADRLRVHALGPWSGGNGPAASRPLPLPPRPPRPPARRRRAAARRRRWSRRAPGRRRPRRACRASAACSAIMWGGSRWAPSAQVADAREYLLCSAAHKRTRAGRSHM